MLFYLSVLLFLLLSHEKEEDEEERRDNENTHGNRLPYDLLQLYMPYSLHDPLSDGVLHMNESIFA